MRELRLRRLVYCLVIAAATLSSQLLAQSDATLQHEEIANSSMEPLGSGPPPLNPSMVSTTEMPASSSSSASVESASSAAPLPSSSTTEQTITTSTTTITIPESSIAPLPPSSSEAPKLPADLSALVSNAPTTNEPSSTVLPADLLPSQLPLENPTTKEPTLTTIIIQASSSAPLAETPTPPSQTLVQPADLASNITNGVISNENGNTFISSEVELNQTSAKLDSLEPKSMPLIDGIKTIIDLSYPLSESTPHWPGKGFKHESIIDGELMNPQNESYYVRSDAINMGIHFGTHIDAPSHFAKDGWSVEKIPLERLVDVPVKVIDLSHIVKMNRSYEFARSDFVDRETGRSLIEPKSVVLVYTGLSKSASEGQKAYTGTDGKNISEMEIPGFSPDAAKLMVETGVYGVGLDAPSADSSRRHGKNNDMDPKAHGILNGANIYILENINERLSEMVNQDAIMRLTVAPLPIVNASGSPVRLFAMTVHDDRPSALTNSAPQFVGWSSTTMWLTIIMSLIALVVVS